MGTSILIARILSIVYLAFAAGLVLSNSYYKKELPKLMKEPSIFVVFFGFIAIVLGMLILSSQNTWLLITIVGWMALLKGVFILVFPEYIFKIGSTFFLPENHYKIMLPILIFAGLLFGYLGFVMK